MSEPNPSLEEVLFEAAVVKASAEEREAFLEGVCRDNPTLRGRLEVLLEGHFQAAGFLRGAPKDPDKPASPAASQSGSTFIGRYKLLEKLGEGGFGEVWMAEQKEPVKRRVALKIIKLGMDTKQVVARFEAERQALALMDHPNIAKVLDAGATDTGRPYFVMELVRGERVTQFCDKNQVTAPERLKLFIQVCRAIQHAHQKGIIHRDIKPSNILVTLHDGLPVPKIIDFGIAKATQQELTEKTVFTQFRQFLGTPAYISPEQAEMSGLDIDTRSDIYSLGVLLYELLTGLTPFDTQELLKAGLEGLRKAIRENQPLRPSTRLSGMAKEELTTAAKRRGAEPPKLISLVRGDLDWIVMKCLEKDRVRRYETANGLARDVERFLYHEPVVARPPSRLYEFKKTVRRHWVGFAAVGAVLLALVAGVVVSTLEAVRARQAETWGRQRFAETESIAKFLSEVFVSPDPARKGRTITVAESLDAASKKLETELANQPSVRAKLEATLGWTYHSLGLNFEAIPLVEKARDYYLATQGLENSNTLLAMHHLAMCYDEVGRHVEALKLQEQVLALRRKVSGPENLNTLFAMGKLEKYYSEAGRFAEALSLAESETEIWRKVNGPEHPNTVGALENLATCREQVGRTNEALKLREQLLPVRIRVSGPTNPETLFAMNNLANSYQFAGRVQEGLKLREQVLAVRKEVSGPKHPDTLMAMINLSASYDQAGRFADALKLREELVPLRKEVSGLEHLETLWAMNDLATSYYEAGRQAEALKLSEEVLALRQKVLGPTNLDTLNSMNSVACLQATSDDPKLRDGTNAVNLAEAAVAGTSRTNAAFLDTLAAAYAEAGRFDQAIAVQQEAIGLLTTREEKADYTLRLKLYQANKPCRVQMSK